MFAAIQARSLNRRAQQEMRAGKFAEAVATLTKLLELRPHDSFVWVKRAVCQRKLQNFQAAYDDAVASLKIKDDDASVWEFVGQMLRKLNRAAEAIPAFDRALQLEPQRSSVRLDRGAALQALARNREAIVDFDGYLNTDPLSVDGFYLKAIAHEDLWEPEAGLTAVEKCLGLSPKAAAAWAVKGRLLGMLKRPDEALAAFDSAEANGFDPEEMIGPRTYQMVEAGRFAQALPILQRVIENWPSRGWYLCRARAYDGLGDTARAAADRRSAVRFLQQRLDALRSTGVTRNVVLIQANHELFQPGDGDRMSLVLLTFDQEWNSDPERMQQLARQLFALKGRPMSSDPIMAAAVNAVSNDFAIEDRRQAIPTELTGGVKLYAADLHIYRDFLPEGRLTEQTRVLPVLAEPGDQGRIEMLPWPGSLAAE